MTTRMIAAAEGQIRAQLIADADNAHAERQRRYAVVPWDGEDGQPTTCPCCGGRIYPKETAEYRAWSVAFDAVEAAAVAAIEGEAIDIAHAALRWNIYGTGLALTIRHRREAEERKIAQGMG